MRERCDRRRRARRRGEKKSAQRIGGRKSLQASVIENALRRRATAIFVRSSSVLEAGLPRAAEFRNTFWGTEVRSRHDLCAHWAMGQDSLRVKTLSGQKG